MSGRWLASGDRLTAGVARKSSTLDSNSMTCRAHQRRPCGVDGRSLDHDRSLLMAPTRRMTRRTTALGPRHQRSYGLACGHVSSSVGVAGLGLLQVMPQHTRLNHRWQRLGSPSRSLHRQPTQVRHSTCPGFRGATFLAFHGGQRGAMDYRKKFKPLGCHLRHFGCSSRGQR